MTFMHCSVFNLAFYGTFMECSWGVQPVLGVFAVIETTKQRNQQVHYLISVTNNFSYISLIFSTSS